MLKYERSLIIVFGQEGVGKTTLCSRLSQFIPYSAQIDAENVAQINPWAQNEKFFRLLWKNISDLTHNFWDYGHHTVIAGSFFDYYSEFLEFRKLLPEEVNVIIIHLCASKAVRDTRRIERTKAYDKDTSDWVDVNFPEDEEFQKHADEWPYFRLDTSTLTVEDTIEAILGYLEPMGIKTEQPVS
jgi:adenylate kinase family enzyme